MKNLRNIDEINDFYLDKQDEKYLKSMYYVKHLGTGKTFQWTAFKETASILGIGPEEYHIVMFEKVRNNLMHNEDRPKKFKFKFVKSPNNEKEYIVSESLAADC